MTADHDAALAKFLAGKPVDIGKVLRDLPATADVALAVAAVLRLIDHPHWLAASCKRLPVAVIRGVLASEVAGTAHLFLRLAVPADAKAARVKTAWQRAVAALHQLSDTTHPWDSEPRRAALTALAGDAAILAALQGLVAHTATVPLEMLGVLAIDASDASVDALIPHFDPALGERDARLERLALLGDFVKPTPALAALFAELSSALAAHRITSPALALGPIIGVGALEVLWFQFMVFSQGRQAMVPPSVQGSVKVDSRELRYLTVTLSTVAPSHDRSGDRTTCFDDARVAQDELDVGRCDAAELPAWLARSATKLKVRWQRFILRTNVKDARVIERWLEGK